MKINFYHEDTNVARSRMADTITIRANYLPWASPTIAEDNLSSFVEWSAQLSYANFLIGIGCLYIDRI